MTFWTFRFGYFLCLSGHFGLTVAPEQRSKGQWKTQTMVSRFQWFIAVSLKEQLESRLCLRLRYIAVESLSCELWFWSDV